MDLSLYMEFYVITIQGMQANVFIVGVTSLYVYIWGTILEDLR